MKPACDLFARTESTVPLGNDCVRKRWTSFERAKKALNDVHFEPDAIEKVIDMPMAMRGDF